MNRAAWIGVAVIVAALGLVGVAVAPVVLAGRESKKAKEEPDAS